MKDKQFPPYDVFHNKLLNCNPPEKNNLENKKLMCSDLTTASPLVLFGLSEKPTSGVTNYFDLQKVREKEKNSLSEILCRYKNKNAAPTFGALQKLVAFYHKRSFGMLKLGCIFCNMANTCLHSSISAKFNLFKEIE